MHESLKRPIPSFEETFVIYFVVKTELALWRQLILLLTALERTEPAQKRTKAAAPIITQNTTLDALDALVTSAADLERPSPYPTVAPTSTAASDNLSGSSWRQISGIRGDISFWLRPSLVSICPGFVTRGLSLFRLVGD